MAGGVNVKMGVSGVAQFKKNIGDAKQAVKTLDAQLQLTEKEFKANGDAEEYMVKKSAELEAKLEAQKRVVDNAEKALKDMAEKGIDKGSKAYQDMYRTMLQAKGEMLDTESALNGLADAGDDAAASTKDLSAQMAEVSKGVSWQNVTDGLGKISDGMTSLMKKAWQTGEAIVQATLGAGSWADELKTTAEQLSTEEWVVTPEELQQMRKTATIIDTDVETIVGARSKLLKGLGNESKGTMSALEFLGIDAEGKDKMDVFWEAGEALMKVGDEAEQEAQATALFGKSWKELKPLFAAGREEYDKKMASWSVVTNDQVDSLGKMDDAYQTMNAEWETFKMQLLSTFSGPMTEGMETITGLFKELNTYLQTEEGQAMLKQIGDTISTLISDLVNINPEDVINSLKGIIDGITDGLRWIADNKDTVVAALGAIGIAFAGIKIATLGANIAKTVSGLKGLLGGNGGNGTTGGTGGTDGGTGIFGKLKVLTAAAAFAAVLNKNAFLPQGNDDLIDKEGNLTALAKDLGYGLDQNGELTGREKIGKYEYIQQQAVQDFWDKYRSGKIITQEDFANATADMGLGDEDFRELMGKIHSFIDETPEWRDVNDLPETIFEDGTEKVKDAGDKMEGAADKLDGLPDEMVKAIQKIGFTFTLEGQPLVAYVSSQLAGELANRRYVP